MPVDHKTALPQVTYTSFKPLSPCICFGIKASIKKSWNENKTKDGHAYFRFHVTQKSRACPNKFWQNTQLAVSHIVREIRTLFAYLTWIKSLSPQSILYLRYQYIFCRLISVAFSPVFPSDLIKSSHCFHWNHIQLKKLSKVVAFKLHVEPMVSG